VTAGRAHSTVVRRVEGVGVFLVLFASSTSSTYSITLGIVECTIVVVSRMSSLPSQFHARDFQLNVGIGRSVVEVVRRMDMDNRR
jgi:hypothetical protein